MVRAQNILASDPLVDVDAVIGNAHADVEVGGADGNVVSASVDDLAGIDADVDVTAAGNAIDVDGHVAVGDGITVDADVGLDGALINAAANVDLGGLLGSGSGCGCGDSGGSTDSGSTDASTGIIGGISLPDLGLNLASLDLPDLGLGCDQA
jgi:hypothetical protein